MKPFLLGILLIGLVACTGYQSKVDIYVTTADKKLTMAGDSSRLVSGGSKINVDHTIVIHDDIRYQEMDGFGAAITGSSAYNLMKMSPENREALLKETFDPVEGYGYSYIRISIGASDFSLDEYTYCDVPGVENFAMHEYDKRDLFPVLKEILAINPEVKILASPWTCPKWMKVNNLEDLKPFDSWTSGQLNPKYYGDYATYFVKYIEAMKAAGFTIEAVTIQNEPLNRGNSASLYMTWQEQRDFIKTALGPAFERNNIQTKILVFDHNYDYDSFKDETKGQEQYPLRIYEDPEAARYIDGAAYHAYGGDKSELLTIHNARPDKNLYFTEMSIGLWGEGYSFNSDLIWNMREVCLGTINNFCKAVMVWNFMLDDKHGPDRPGGCNTCLGAIDIDSSDYKTMQKNSHYYTIAHLFKVIKPGAVRVKAEGEPQHGLHYAAFHNTDGSSSFVLLNELTFAQIIRVKQGDREFVYEVKPQSIISCIWK